MAHEYKTSMYAHPSIYKPEERQMNIYFSTPDDGINTETGILLMIPGFGGNANSKVYKKMRNQFADEFNVITVQCDYFGWQFMQSDRYGVRPVFNENDLKSIFTQDEFCSVYVNEIMDIEKVFQVASNYEMFLKFDIDLDETLSDFNDMGIMQAIDNITAVLAVMAIMEDNQFKFDKGKILIYGHSHGAYLAYLCNAFAPNLFSMIIDNSAWLYPNYLKPESNRYLLTGLGKARFEYKFNYLAKMVLHDPEILSLPFLYKELKNQCKIICFHGISDHFRNTREKEEFCKLINNCIFNLISENEVDGEVFKSTNHGLDANFLKLFDVVFERYGLNSNTKEIQLPRVSYKTCNYEYEVSYDTGMPTVVLKSQQ